MLATLVAVLGLSIAAPTDRADSVVIPPAVFQARRERAMARMPNNIMLFRAARAENTLNADAFHQDANFYYFTGLPNAVGALLAIDSRKHESWLFVPDSGELHGGYIDWITAPYAYVVPGAASAATLHIEHVVSWKEFASFLDRRLTEDTSLIVTPATPVGPMPDLANVLTGQTDSGMWLHELRVRWPHARFDFPRPAVLLRETKDTFELRALRGVATSSAAALQTALRVTAPGKRQQVAESEVAAACVRAGATGVSFWPWIMSGPNSSFFTAINSLADYRAKDRVMRTGEIARIDVGCAQNHYEGDVGRTVPVSGTFTPEQRETWELLVAAYRRGLEVIRPGATPANVFAACRAVVEARVPSLRTNLARRVGTALLAKDGFALWELHGVGVQGGEWEPDTLRANQVLAFEPIIVVDTIGFYLEDMVLVRGDGAEVLTKGLPYTADEIERAMRPRLTSGAQRTPSSRPGAR